MPSLRRLLARSDVVAAKVRSAAPMQLRDLARRLPVRDDVVLYEAYGGRGVLCHPEAIFRELIDDPDLAHLQHVWVLTRDAAQTEAAREVAAHPRVSIVRPGSAAYIRRLATARWLVNNATFPPGFGKRDGQVYLNTWHGTPLKSMGYDQPDAIGATRNVVRNFLMADYLLTSGDYMTSRMYVGGYRLTNIFAGQVIDEGGPRTDRQCLDETGRGRVLARLRRAGVVVADGDRVVLYAPTWQGESFATARDDAAVLGERVRELAGLLPPGHRVLLRVHQQVYAAAAARADLRGLLVPGDVPANEVLGVTDVLVSDYSSIFFDFLPTGRPIVFFTPDQDVYTDERGVYLDLVPSCRDRRRIRSPSSPTSSRPSARARRSTRRRRTARSGGPPWSGSPPRTTDGPRPGSSTSSSGAGARGMPSPHCRATAGPPCSSTSVE